MDTENAIQKIYAEGGINWTWYIRVLHHQDNTVTVTGHTRFHNSVDHTHPKSDGIARVIEDNDRNIVSIKVGTEVFNVRNPAHVFSFAW